MNFYVVFVAFLGPVVSCATHGRLGTGGSGLGPNPIGPRRDLGGFGPPIGQSWLAVTSCRSFFLRN